MRLSAIGDKEIVDISKGSLHGRLWDAEMLFDEKSGLIHALVVPDPAGGRHGYMDRKLPWNSILVIGEDMIVFQSIG